MGKTHRKKSGENNMTTGGAKKQLAFQYYCENIPKKRIAELVGTSHATIIRLSKKHDWEKKKIEHEQIVKENARFDSQAQNEAVIRAMKRIWARNASEGTVKVSSRDVLESIKVERLLGNQSTENVAVSFQQVMGEALDEIWREKRNRERRIGSFKAKKNDAGDGAGSSVGSG
jgi:uncharacterized protein YjcR